MEVVLGVSHMAFKNFADSQLPTILHLTYDLIFCPSIFLDSKLAKVDQMVLTSSWSFIE